MFLFQVGTADQHGMKPTNFSPCYLAQADTHNVNLSLRFLIVGRGSGSMAENDEDPCLVGSGVMYKKL